MNKYTKELHNMLKELDQKASPAPWGLETYSGADDEEYTVLEDARGNAIIVNRHDPLDDSEELDLFFITYLRNNIKVVLERIEELEKENHLLSWKNDPTGGVFL